MWLCLGHPSVRDVESMDGEVATDSRGREQVDSINHNLATETLTRTDVLVQEVCSVCLYSSPARSLYPARNRTSPVCCLHFLAPLGQVAPHLCRAERQVLRWKRTWKSFGKMCGNFRTRQYSWGLHLLWIRPFWKEDLYGLPALRKEDILIHIR